MIMSSKDKRLTAKGIYIQLDSGSPYSMEEQKTGYRFYFSSKVYKYKFYDKVFNEDLFTEKNYEINHKLKTNGIDYSVLIVLQLYKEIETRGFCVMNGDEKIEENNLKLIFN